MSNLNLNIGVRSPIKWVASAEPPENPDLVRLEMWSSSTTLTPDEADALADDLQRAAARVRANQPGEK